MLGATRLMWTLIALGVLSVRLGRQLASDADRLERALAAVVLAQLVVYVKGYFTADGWFGFGAVFGFLSCLSMVLFAKGLGVFLKRPNDYYDDRNDERDDDA